MGLLPWSFGFLLIISILSWSAVVRMSEETLITKTIVRTVTQQAGELTRKISSESSAAYRALCTKNGEKPSDEDEEEEEEEEEDPKKREQRQPSKKAFGQKSRARLTSKLHISSLFTNEDTGQKPTQERIFRNLLKVLYGEQPLFSEHRNSEAQLQELFEEVRLKALEWGPKLPMGRASTLANIELSGYKKEDKQFILFLILKGGDGELFRGARCHIRPLLPYISMSKKDFCMSVFLAPVPLLMALFENNDVVEKVVEYRANIVKKIHDEKERSAFSEGDKDKKDILDILSDEFKSQFEASLPSGIEPQYIDFRVSRTTPKNFL